MFLRVLPRDTSAVWAPFMRFRANMVQNDQSIVAETAGQWKEISEIDHKGPLKRRRSCRPRELRQMPHSMLSGLGAGELSIGCRPLFSLSRKANCLRTSLIASPALIIDSGACNRRLRTLRQRLTYDRRLEVGRRIGPGGVARAVCRRQQARPRFTVGHRGARVARLPNDDALVDRARRVARR